MAADGAKWSRLDTELDIPRFFGATAVLDSRIYLMGGVSQIDINTIAVHDTVSVLDTREAVPQWRDDLAAPMPDGVFFSGGAAVPEGANVAMAGKIITCGGFNADDENKAFVYDPAEDTWHESWPVRTQRLLFSSLHLVPKPRGASVWAVGGHSNLFNSNTEIMYLGTDPTGPWVGIRTCPNTIPAGCSLKVGMDLAGNKEATAIDCYVVLEVLGAWYFMTADPYFPYFTTDPAPFFANAPIPEDITYCGPLLEIPLPSDIPSFSGSVYAATLRSGSADLAGGLAWADFAVLGD